MIVRSPIYPQLWVTQLGVKFVDGVAEVGDEVATKLVALGFGIEADGSNSKPDPKPEADTKPDPKPAPKATTTSTRGRRGRTTK